MVEDNTTLEASGPPGCREQATMPGTPHHLSPLVYLTGTECLSAPLAPCLNTNRPEATGSVSMVFPIPPRPDHRRVPDTLCRKGAMALAKRLERYWHERGYPAARFWAEPIEERFQKIGTSEIYRIKSNLLNGLPPRHRDDGRR